MKPFDPKPLFYILDGHTPKAVDSVLTWSEWHLDADRTVARTELGETQIVTSFVGVHRYPTRRPLLFETIIARYGDAASFRLYATWLEAAEGHKDAVNAEHASMRVPW